MAIVTSFPPSLVSLLEPEHARQLVLDLVPCTPRRRDL